MTVVHLTTSPFFGGPERQMLGLARAMNGRCRSVFLLFPDRGKSAAFAERLGASALDVTILEHDTPQFLPAVVEITHRLTHLRADVLCCHGYKADLLGYLAARAQGVPVVAVSRGWTWATARVRLYESFDRRMLRRMDRVVCVSAGQAGKVCGAGVTPRRITVIRNAIDASRFGRADPSARQILCQMFGRHVQHIILAAGRLSPEKGFAQLVEAARLVVRQNPQTGFVLIGDGPLRDTLARHVALREMESHFVLAGFRNDADQLIAHADIVALPSFTEGLPNVALEALAAGVPVVATDVGGTPEVVEHGVCGWLVPPGDPTALAQHICNLLDDEPRRLAMGRNGRQRMLEQFTFAAQSREYLQLFTGMSRPGAARLSGPRQQST